jgi:hypothetical protein
MKRHLRKFENFEMDELQNREMEMGHEEEMMPPYYKSHEDGEFDEEFGEEEMMPHEMMGGEMGGSEDEFGEEEEFGTIPYEEEGFGEEDEFNELGEEEMMPTPREERFEETFRFKYLRKFENFAASTEEEAGDFMDQFGEDSDSANTIGLGTACGECNCLVEECSCGCPSCKAKQSKGMSFKREPYKQDYTTPDRAPITERKKAKPDFLDVDKDGDKKEPMKKAAKEAKEKGGKKSTGKGLTAKQKKLPEGLRKAIEARKKK